jgi:NADH-quinone oxidoreductase subunit N
MYFDKPVDDAPLAPVGVDTQVLLSINGLSMLALGMFPAGLLALCSAALS